MGDNTSRGNGAESVLEPGLDGALDNVLLRVTRNLVCLPESATALAEMPFAQVRCLQVVARLEGRKMHDLADALEIKLPAVSQIVERLVRRGLLERRSDPRDRRVSRIWLTRSARQLLDEAQGARQRRLATALERLGPEAATRLREDLERLAEATDALGAAGLDTADPMADLMARRARRRRPWSAGSRIE